MKDNLSLTPCIREAIFPILKSYPFSDDFDCAKLTDHFVKKSVCDTFSKDQELKVIRDLSMQTFIHTANTKEGY